MALIDWRASYSIGIDSVDHEHRELIELINALHDRLNTDGSWEEISRFLGELEAGISAHFALEEKEMRDMGYGGFDEHKADHEWLLDEIRAIGDAFEAGAYANLDDVLAEHLKSWFSDHFRNQDAPLHAFLLDRRS